MMRETLRSSLARRRALAAALAVAICAGSRPSGAASSEPADAGLTVLHLSEAADREIRRDRLRAQLRVEVVAGNAKQVQADINRRMTSALDKVKALPGIKPQTGGYSVYEERQQNVPTRWRGNQALTLVGRDFVELLTIVGELQNDGLALMPETARAAQDELTSVALKRLSERAERIAADLHLEVLRYRDIRVGNVGGDRPIPRAMLMGGAAAGAAVAPPAAEAGDATVQVSVDADVILGPAEDKGP